MPDSILVRPCILTLMIIQNHQHSHLTNYSITSTRLFNQQHSLGLFSQSTSQVISSLWDQSINQGIRLFSADGSGKDRVKSQSCSTLRSQTDLANDFLPSNVKERVGIPWWIRDQYLHTICIQSNTTTRPLSTKSTVVSGQDQCSKWFCDPNHNTSP